MQYATARTHQSLVHLQQQSIDNIHPRDMIQPVLVLQAGIRRWQGQARAGGGRGRAGCKIARQDDAFACWRA